MPAQLWAALTVARHAYDTAHRRVLEAVGFDTETGRMAAPCSLWHGEINPGRSCWSVVLTASGDAQRWPVHDGRIAWKDTERDAVSFLEALPAEFYVLPAYGGDLQHVRREQLRVEPGGWGPSLSACHRCGWPRHEHNQGSVVQP